MNKNPVKFIIYALIVVALSVLIAYGLTTTHVHIVDTNIDHLKGRSYTSACDLLSLEDAKTVLGNNAVQEPKSKANVITANYVSTECGFTSTDDVGSISINLYSSSVNDAQNMFQSSEGKNTQSIVGIGDKAFWNADISELNILKNGYWLRVSYQSASQDSTSYSIQQQIALKAIAKL